MAGFLPNPATIILNHTFSVLFGGRSGLLGLAMGNQVPGALPYEKTELLAGNCEETLRVIKILFCGRGLKYFSPLSRLPVLINNWFML